MDHMIWLINKDQFLGNLFKWQVPKKVNNPFKVNQGHESNDIANAWSFICIYIAAIIYWSVRDLIKIVKVMYHLFADLALGHLFVFAQFGILIVGTLKTSCTQTFNRYPHDLNQTNDNANKWSSARTMHRVLYDLDTLWMSTMILWTSFQSKPTQKA